MNDSGEKAGRYKAQSIHYMENALSFMERGDAEKASEFLWGSMSQALKAVAASKGITLRSHSGIWDYARELSKNLGDVRIFDAFKDANSLHSNFYESGLRMEYVNLLSQGIRVVVAKLLDIVPSEASDTRPS